MIDVNHVKFDACQTKIKYVFYETFSSDVKMDYWNMLLYVSYPIYFHQ